MWACSILWRSSPSSLVVKKSASLNESLASIQSRSAWLGRSISRPCLTTTSYIVPRRQTAASRSVPPDRSSNTTRVPSAGGAIRPSTSASDPPAEVAITSSPADAETSLPVDGPSTAQDAQRSHRSKTNQKRRIMEAPPGHGADADTSTTTRQGAAYATGPHRARPQMRSRRQCSCGLFSCEPYDHVAPARVHTPHDRV